MPITHNIFTQYNYIKNGEHKCGWHRVGILKSTESGRTYLRLFHQPETTFYVVERDLPDGEAAPASD